MDKHEIVESLSINELKILPYLNKDFLSICEDSGLDNVSVTRALEYLKNKKIVNLDSEKKGVVELGVNGALYLKKGLPERRLLNSLRDKRVLQFEDAMKGASLSDEELKAAIGVLKKNNLIDIKNQKIIFNPSEEAAKKSSEEIFLESLPVEFDTLSDEQKVIFKSLKSRKGLVEIREERILKIKPTSLGNELMNMKIKAGNFIEQITPETLKKDSNWKGKKFRRYDVGVNVPRVYGGKRHFVNQASDYARKIWTEMGFKEMTGNMVENSFWVFDSLFTPQDHPAREMQDTFFLNEEKELPNGKIIKSIKEAHEGKIKNLKSKGWGYEWSEDASKKVILRTHTTVLSAQTLAKLARTPRGPNLPAKFFALGKCFRNETLDWKHGFEFNQTEGIVVDENANFRHLLGYLKQFFEKMGFEKIRFRPAYFPYTEPSVEIDVYHPGKKEWLELGGAGMFRPEVVVSLIGKNIPVLAWGPGFDRILMDYYKINDIRELYKNDITQLRKIKFWMKS